MECGLSRPVRPHPCGVPKVHPNSRRGTKIGRFKARTNAPSIDPSQHDRGAGTWIHGPSWSSPGQVPALLGYPLAGRPGGDATGVDLAAGNLNKEEDVQALEPGRLTVKKLVASIWAACWLISYVSGWPSCRSADANRLPLALKR